jgi:hypothetical protein
VKKILAMAILIVLGCISMQAQEVNFGLKGGFNIANLTGDNSSSLDEVTSFHVGAMAEIPLSEKFSFQPEVLFSGQGYSVGKNTVALSYLNVPLMGKYYVAKGFSLEAGPQVGFLLKAKAESFDVKDAFKTVDFGVNLGLGYKLDNGLNFGARYNFGLTNINDLKGVNSENRNAVLQVSVGYFFF